MVFREVGNVVQGVEDVGEEAEKIRKNKKLMPSKERRKNEAQKETYRPHPSRPWRRQSIRSLNVVQAEGGLLLDGEFRNRRLCASSCNLVFS
jgi:hypothetical protein